MIITEFREHYQAAKTKGKYQAGSAFDQKRADFFKQALDWQEQESRHAAAALLRQTIKDWTEWPGKKERKQEVKQALSQLDGLA